MNMVALLAKGVVQGRYLITAGKDQTLSRAARFF
jgi:hypothetical protein